MTRSCYVHVGTHKTGTTSIQHMLAANEESLLSAGVLVPKSGRPTRLTGNNAAAHHNVAWQLSGDFRFDFSYGTLLQLCDEIASSHASTVVLSSEDFGHVYRHAEHLLQLKRALESSDCVVKIVVTLRSQAEYAQSLYAEFLKQGFDFDIGAFFEAAIAEGGFHFRDAWDLCLDYAELLEAFADVFGEDNVLVVPYDPLVRPRDFLLRLLTVFTQLSPFSASDAFLDMPRLNTSLSFSEVLTALFAAAQVRTATAWTPNKILDEISPILRDELQHSRFDVMTNSLRDSFARRFSAQNASLRQRFTFSPDVDLPMRPSTRNADLQFDVIRSAQSRWGATTLAFHQPPRLHTAKQPL